MDSRESKDLGTRLHVTNLASNAQVNSSKDFIEPSSKALNYLIATRPKLKGNTLHMRASFLE